MQTPLIRRFFKWAACLSFVLLASARAEEGEWKSIFDGKSLAGWKVTEFGGRGEVAVKDGQISLESGNDLTGVNFVGEMPKTNYELMLEAKRVEGGDFFCGLTFPIGESSCTFVVGGWGGSVVGLSSINGNDASENETAKVKEFENGRWYKIRLRVTPEKIEAWIDDEPMLDLETKDKKLGMRLGEIELSMPCGIASYHTRSSLRAIRLRSLKKLK
jgi:hypothetical protein